MTIIYLASISIELGKGALKHNSRIFNTSNTNPERSHLNKEYINDDIKMFIMNCLTKLLSVITLNKLAMTEK